MTNKQKTAIKCAFADLVGSLQAHNEWAWGAHDWKAHETSILDLQEAFKFLEEEK